MKTLEQIIDKLENSNISIDKYSEDNILCGYELNTYTDCGVNQIVFLDFRNTGLIPTNAEDFLKVYQERIESIDIDEEIELNRQDTSYKANFSLTVAFEDFKDWKENLQNIFSKPTKKTPQQRQFEQVKDKFGSLLAEIEETLKLMPLKGDRPSDCQRTGLQIQINELDSFVNGIELEDFTPNEYSQEWQLSYS
ncbi:MAG: hypothetical protein QM499_01205 [Flavobacteriaceae bacterium]